MIEVIPPCEEHRTDGGPGRGAHLVPSLMLLLLPACAASNGVAPGEEVLVLEVAAEKVACVGEIQMLCLQVRTPGEEAWRKFYDPIEGFEHDTGVRYTLEVARREVEDPPADASRYAYRLLRIIDRAPGGAGQRSVRDPFPVGGVRYALTGAPTGEARLRLPRADRRWWPARGGRR